jgi:glycosyltransferase involved in cell wall biosynthesis
MAMTLSLIVCSRNRADSLAECLGSLDGSELQQTNAQVILVDNSSTDETAVIMQSFRQRAPCPVEIVDERQPGLSRARNAALARATGEVLVFIDDDCLPAPGYFAHASMVFESGLFHFCGGRILLHDPTDADYGCVTHTERETYSPGAFLPPGIFQGANLLLHRRVVETVGPFDTMLGAGTPFRCEDIDYCARASRAGFTGAFIPELVVYHHHRRKPGTESLERLRQENDYARGAFYMKCVLRGNHVYLRKWLKKAVRPRRWPTTKREFRGGVDYFRARRARLHGT